MHVVQRIAIGSLALLAGILTARPAAAAPDLSTTFIVSDASPDGALRRAELLSPPAAHVSLTAGPEIMADEVQTPHNTRAASISQTHPMIPLPASALASLAGLLFVTAYVRRHSPQLSARHF